MLALHSQGYSCDHLNDVPEPQRCQFVMEECPSDSRVPYTEWYYCSVAPRGLFATGAFMVLLACVLPLLFSLLGSTAELYFSPTMSLVSQTIPKMRPRFAGVTFVAMGNGAPDLSANISAIRSGQVALSAGAFTGAAMFVQCVVASEVIRISKGVTCKGAVLRDVGTYAVSIMGVGLCLYSGVITHWFVVCAVLVYVAYASWVFAGDEWHAAGRPNLQPDRAAWEDLRAMLLQRNLGDS
ncbi:hypothetical protein DUNSADRAFT_790 [Dunaliella salina]|uniref:Sodium/calcium exchanger membrane region domain-containing protein n=1 Tax=Dunaliella salina TaxID=3046 RepID=A0ABQ7FYB4_DUNSA|nr:hypothetical protein DUNSADRAFT_790 [Dunaliella salina]|eukprot:KAF5827358.1 hypothetical protein DUNSADRAFT_790 [Dunaliella salina]